MKRIYMILAVSLLLTSCAIDVELEPENPGTVPVKEMTVLDIATQPAAGTIIVE